MTEETVADVARIRYGLAFDDYLQDPGISRSALLDLAQSPAHFFALHRAPDRPAAKPPTPAMAAGSLAHTVLLEPQEVMQRYRVRPEGLDLRTKEGKAWAAGTLSTMEAVTREQVTIAQAQADAMLAFPDVAFLLESGEAEVSVFWTDPRTGLRCKARPDWMHTLDDGRVIVFDYKTALDVSQQGFGKAAANFHYDVQAAFYSEGIERAGLEVAAFVFGAVTTEYPFIAQSYAVPDYVMDGARGLVHALLRLLRACEDAHTWPTFADDTVDLWLPPWHMNRQEEAITRVGRLLQQLHAPAIPLLKEITP